jgi:hypothetical protein
MTAVRYLVSEVNRSLALAEDPDGNPIELFEARG